MYLHVFSGHSKPPPSSAAFQGSPRTVRPSNRIITLSPWHCASPLACPWIQTEQSAVGCGLWAVDRGEFALFDGVDIKMRSRISQWTSCHGLPLSISRSLALSLCLPRSASICLCLPLSSFLRRCLPLLTLLAAPARHSYGARRDS